MNKIIIEDDAWVWIEHLSPEGPKRHGLGFLGVDVEIEDRRDFSKMPYKILVQKWLDLIRYF